MLNNPVMVCFSFKSKKMTTFNTDPTYTPFNILHLSNKKTHQSWFHSKNSTSISLIFFSKADEQNILTLRARTYEATVSSKDF